VERVGCRCGNGGSGSQGWKEEKYSDRAEKEVRSGLRRVENEEIEAKWEVCGVDENRSVPNLVGVRFGSCFESDPS
jgi:hypothetical protein